MLKFFFFFSHKNKGTERTEMSRSSGGDWWGPAAGQEVKWWNCENHLTLPEKSVSFSALVPCSRWLSPPPLRIAAQALAGKAFTTCAEAALCRRRVSRIYIQPLLLTHKCTTTNNSSRLALEKFVLFVWKQQLHWRKHVHKVLTGRLLYLYLIEVSKQIKIWLWLK